MRAVTTFHPEGLRLHGSRMLESFMRYWPEDVELTVYAEDCVDDALAVVGDRGKVMPTDWDDLRKFREVFQANHVETTDYRFNAPRYAAKGWAIASLQDCNDYCFWVDADVITTAPVTKDFLRSLFPRNTYLSFIGRDGLQRPYTETGFLGFNGHSLWHVPFLHYFLNIWRSGRIVELPEWHDCYALDAARKHYQLPENDLNVAREFDHPFCKTVLAPFMDHLKGPRKAFEASPEMGEA
jgi:hypothetical protein